MKSKDYPKEKRKQTFTDSFLAGQRDCKEGIPHEDRNEGYTRGYSAEYEKLESDTWFSEQRNK